MSSYNLAVQSRDSEFLQTRGSLGIRSLACPRSECNVRGSQCCQTSQLFVLDRCGSNLFPQWESNRYCLLLTQKFVLECVFTLFKNQTNILYYVFSKTQNPYDRDFHTFCDKKECLESISMHRLHVLHQSSFYICIILGSIPNIFLESH